MSVNSYGFKKWWPRSLNLNNARVSCNCIINDLTSLRGNTWYEDDHLLGCWRFKLYGMWHCVLRKVVPDIWKTVMPSTLQSTAQEDGILQQPHCENLRSCIMDVVWQVCYQKMMFFIDPTLITSYLNDLKIFVTTKLVFSSVKSYVRLTGYF